MFVLFHGLKQKCDWCGSFITWMFQLWRQYSISSWHPSVEQQFLYVLKSCESTSDLHLLRVSENVASCLPQCSWLLLRFLSHFYSLSYYPSSRKGLIQMHLATPGSVSAVSLFTMYNKWGSFIISGKNHLFRWLLTQRPDLKERINQQEREGCTLLHIVASSSGYSQKRSKYNYFCVCVCVWWFVFIWRNE